MRINPVKAVEDLVQAVRNKRLLDDADPEVKITIKNQNRTVRNSVFTVLGWVLFASGLVVYLAIAPSEESEIEKPTAEDMDSLGKSNAGGEEHDLTNFTPALREHYSLEEFKRIMDAYEANSQLNYHFIHTIPAYLSDDVREDMSSAIAKKMASLRSFFLSKGKILFFSKSYVDTEKVDQVRGRTRVLVLSGHFNVDLTDFLPSEEGFSKQEELFAAMHMPHFNPTRNTLYLPAADHSPVTKGKGVMDVTPYLWLAWIDAQNFIDHGEVNCKDPRIAEIYGVVDGDYMTSAKDLIDSVTKNGFPKDASELWERIGTIVDKGNYDGKLKVLSDTANQRLQDEGKVRRAENLRRSVLTIRILLAMEGETSERLQVILKKLLTDLPTMINFGFTGDHWKL